MFHIPVPTPPPVHKRPRGIEHAHHRTDKPTQIFMQEKKSDNSTSPEPLLSLAPPPLEMTPLIFTNLVRRAVRAVPSVPFLTHEFNTRRTPPSPPAAQRNDEMDVER